jgi:PIN domain nuclease of toxin-antitoxin system
MRILLDTHIFLWAITNDARLPARAKALYTSASSELYLSIVSLWEIVLKFQIGKLPLPASPAAYLLSQLLENQIRLLDLKSNHVFGMLELPNLHRDPFDRLLIAQSRAEKLRILTSDEQLKQYDANFA